MTKNAHLKPTAAELEILQILWKYGPSTVRFVNEKLNERKVVGYTTTLKIMQLMNEKHFLERETSQRSHIYCPLVKEKETQGVLLDRFLETAFGGSALKLVMQILGHHRTSKAEIAQIKDFLKSLERGEE
ncbi:BlaI/MecI/CopY family transcriptional regulator [candidate division CSSED10-310 bacterium]|uniref:BlaI/MecI/CopY family transcriptional regulator n=1 Tax=candidate division CSSED10-310 bacterium TaxID=2855610 RepID=A0ABV6Z2C2_UNCC1